MLYRLNLLGPDTNMTKLPDDWIHKQAPLLINPWRAKFLRENINIYLHYMSFLHTNKTQVAEIPPRVRQGPAYST